MALKVSHCSAARLCGGVFAILGVVLLLAPQIVMAVFDLESTTSAEVIAKRASIVFAGLAYLVISTAAHPRNAIKDRIDEAVILLLLGLAILGAVEWMYGRVGVGVWIAIGTEIFLAGLVVMARAVPQTEGQSR